MWDLPVSEAKTSINKTREFFNSLNLPDTLIKVGIDGQYFEQFAENIVRRGRTGSFKNLTKEDIISIYRRSL